MVKNSGVFCDKTYILQVWCKDIKAVEDIFCFNDRYIKSHGACLIKMTLISTAHFPKRSHLLRMDMSCDRHSQQKKSRVCLPQVPPTQIFKSRVQRTELFKCTVKNFSDRDTGY